MGDPQDLSTNTQDLPYEIYLTQERLHLSTVLFVENDFMGGVLFLLPFSSFWVFFFLSHVYCM